MKLIFQTTMLPDQENLVLDFGDHSTAGDSADCFESWWADICGGGKAAGVVVALEGPGAQYEEDAARIVHECFSPNSTTSLSTWREYIGFIHAVSESLSEPDCAKLCHYMLHISADFDDAEDNYDALRYEFSRSEVAIELYAHNLPGKMSDDHVDWEGVGDDLKLHEPIVLDGTEYYVYDPDEDY